MPRSKIWYIFFCYLVWSIFERSFKRPAYGDSFGSFLMEGYVCGLNCCSSLSDDMKGSWDGSFWLKLSLKNEMFLHNGNDTYWIIFIGFWVSSWLWHLYFRWVKRWSKLYYGQLNLSFEKSGSCFFRFLVKHSIATGVYFVSLTSIQ